MRHPLTREFRLSGVSVPLALSLNLRRCDIAGSVRSAQRTMLTWLEELGLPNIQRKSSCHGFEWK